MADVICRWNAANTYSRYERNCQHFIDEICQAIGVQLNFKGSLSDYLVELRQKGTCELQLLCCNINAYSICPDPEYCLIS